MLESKESVSAANQSVVVLDGIALQDALRAALAVAPSKGEHSVIALRLPLGRQSAAAVCAYDPAREIYLSVAVPTDHVEVADDRDQVVELTPPAVRQLLAMKIKAPKVDDPWPSVSWGITENRVTQTDEGQLFGRMSRVLREDRDRPTLGDIPSKLSELVDAVPETTGVSQLTAPQTKALGNVLGHLGEPARLQPLQPAEGQLAACLVLSESLVAFFTRADKETPADEPAPENKESVTFDDALNVFAENMSAPTASLKIVRSNPPGGIA